MTTAARERPWVSVVIPAYNSARFLPETLNSVLAQTYPAHEILVIDDGSTDDTEAVVARYAPRVKYLRQANQGVPTARNLGIERSKGDWICFLDADDIWVPEKLEKQIEAVRQDSGLHFTFTSYYLFGAASGICRMSAELQEWDPERELLVPSVTIMPSSAMVRRDLAHRFPTWAGNDCEDSIYFNEMAEQGRFLALDEPLVGYRRHPRSAQARPETCILGCANLYRWASNRGADAPSCLSRVLGSLTKCLVRAKWKRNWHQYWTIREFVLNHWPATEVSAVFFERIYPPAVYRFKDMWDRFVVCRS